MNKLVHKANIMVLWMRRRGYTKAIKVFAILCSRMTKRNGRCLALESKDDLKSIADHIDSTNILNGASYDFWYTEDEFGL